jgi:Arc/MetJ family transcription regulator
MSRTRIDVEVDDAHLAEVMRRHGLETAAEAVELALRLVASRPMSRAEMLEHRAADAVEELVTVDALRRFTDTLEDRDDPGVMSAARE